MFSTRRWIDDTSRKRVFERMANLTASSSRIFMCHIFSVWDHYPHVEIPWHVATQPCLDASENIVISGGTIDRGLPLYIFIFVIHHDSSSFACRSRVIKDSYARLFLRAFICICCKNRIWSLAGKIACIAEVNFPINWVNSLKVILLLNAFWDIWTISSTFLWGGDNFIATESISRPRNSIFLYWIQHCFFQVDYKT